MKSLFDISLEYAGLLDLANDIEYDHETGEVIDNSEQLTELFDEIADDLGNKLNNCQYVLKQLKSNEDMLADEIKRLQSKKTALKNNQDRLKKMMLNAMKFTEQDKIKTDLFSFSIRKSEAVQVESIDNIPRSLLKIKKEADKTKIKKFIKDGNEIEGVKIVENESLGVR